MNYALYLGTVPPPLCGRASTYIDGKPAAPKAPMSTKDNAARRKGEATKARIMELVDEWDEVDMNFLEAEETLGITRRAIQAHLVSLVDAGELIRITPERHRPGACTIWRRPITRT